MPAEWFGCGTASSRVTSLHRRQIANDLPALGGN
jgi:hypothetical protein